MFERYTREQLEEMLDGDERPTPPLTRKLIREKLTTDAVHDEKQRADEAERTVELMRYAMTLARLLERHALCKRIGPCGIQY